MESVKKRAGGRMSERQPAFWRARIRRMRRTPAAERRRGQSLVEFALIAPLFLLILFGVVEYALINASIGAFNFAAKEGARYEAIIGNGQAPGATPPPLDQYVVNSVILPQVAGVVMAQAKAVVVYKAVESGGCFGSGSVTNQPLPNCATQDVLQPNGSGVWGFTQSGWMPGSPGRNDQLSNADYLGVFISYQYTYLTAFFAITSPTITLSAISVQRIEPQQYGDGGQSQPVANVSGGSSPPSPWASNPFSALLDLVGFAVILPRRNYTFLTGGRA